MSFKALVRHLHIPGPKNYQWVTLTKFPNGEIRQVDPEKHYKRKNKIPKEQETDNSQEDKNVEPKTYQQIYAEEQEKRRNEGKQFYSFYHAYNTLRKDRAPSTNDLPYRQSTEKFIPNYEESCYYDKLSKQFLDIHQAREVQEKYKRQYSEDEDEE